MNYTIISFKENYSYRSDQDSSPADLDIMFFRDHERDFISTWARIEAKKQYDTLTICINGTPDTDMTDEEDEEYSRLWDLMQIELEKVKLELEAAKIEADGKAAEQKARLLAHMERERDLQTYAALQRKLNLK